MHRAIPAVLATAAAFVVIWQFQPTPHSVTPQASVPVATGSAPDPGSGATSGSSSQTVAGSAESTRFGTIQVAAVFDGQTISEIQVLRAPDDRPTVEALPTLRTEALQAQSAEIDTVSGATMTSEAYARSLRSAIDARNR